MDHVYLKPRAKINLALDVIGKRPDGYHELKMIMQTVALCDDLIIKKTGTGIVEIKTNLRYLPVGEKNLVYKAVQYLKQTYNLPQGIYIKLNKRIPVAAGLGGGSADCAAALAGMRSLFGLPLSNTELIKLGERFGADVPFCVMQGTALACGKGEVLTALPDHPQAYVLIARPPVVVSTADVFKAFDTAAIEQKKRPDIACITDGIKKKALRLIAQGMGNVLETVTEARVPQIPYIKHIMLENKALAALMSGSGPSVFGLFERKADAMRALYEIRESKKMDIKELYLTSIYNPIKRTDTRNG